MKIIIATPLYPPEIGGPATYTKEIAEKLKKNHDITIVAFADNPTPIDGVRIFSISKKKFLPIRLFLYYRLIKNLSKEADIIHAQNPVASGLPAVLAGHKTNTPVVIRFVGDEAWERATLARVTKKNLKDWISSPETNFKSKIIMRIEKYVLKKANLVMTPSKFLKDIVVTGHNINKDKVIINYNAVKQPTNKIYNIKTSHKILTTARLTSWKGVGGIINAVNILKNKIPDIKLTVAGDGPELENLKKLTTDLKLNNNISFLGNVSRTKTEELRRKSSIYVLNSTYEGLPHTILTSFYTGIPVIATNIPGTNEVAINNETAILVEPNNHKMLAIAIQKLINDTEKQKELIGGGYKILKEKFSWQSHVDKLLSISSSLISHPRS